MTVKDLRSELSAVPERFWIASSYPDQAGVVAWLPLVKISATDIWLGIDREGVWTLGRLEGAVESSRESMPSSWVTILDGDENALRTALDSAAERFRISSAILQGMVPIDAVLTMAIKSRSSHWVERAVHWMSERDISREHLELLQDLTTADWASQRIRHIARRLVKTGG
ncbi:hypothetical protein [Streptomyces sp. NPDC058294]|uniref:hypothetical protein n=1 Tax=Streptomyces sp. NPDC058294 TaxID=3346430 RepID=UPI0036E60635